VLASGRTRRAHALRGDAASVEARRSSASRTRQHAANAVQRNTRWGFRVDKPAEAVKFDALIALVMAFDRSQHIEPPTQFHGWL
jgi:hypothetical protein